MNEHRFTLDNSNATFNPSEPRPPVPRHRLRFKNVEGDSWTGPEGHTLRALSDLTIVTCACGLDTDAIASDDARLVYEEHRNLIRDEITAGGRP
ncbi:hypothetical protein AB0D12_40300 [Streptomyces sp. NPDC048479]|uniref:hypothetical protein n=1 Tax=Streptomyces sp. NPDC048479 TaxID=3154725 RepID=UPI003437B47D